MDTKYGVPAEGLTNAPSESQAHAPITKADVSSDRQAQAPAKKAELIRHLESFCGRLAACDGCSVFCENLHNGLQALKSNSTLTPAERGAIVVAVHALFGEMPGSDPPESLPEADQSRPM